MMHCPLASKCEFCSFVCIYSVKSNVKKYSGSAHLNLNILSLMLSSMQLREKRYAYIKLIFV